MVGRIKIEQVLIEILSDDFEHVFCKSSVSTVPNGMYVFGSGQFGMPYAKFCVYAPLVISLSSCENQASIFWKITLDLGPWIKKTNVDAF